MVGNVSKATYRTFNDWDSGVDRYQEIENLTAINAFVEELNNTQPILRTEHSNPIVEGKNNETFKEVIVHLKDGVKVSFYLLEGGYIYYRYVEAYFKIDNEKFVRIWKGLH